MTEAYVHGLQVNLDMAAEDVDAAGGDINYCSGQAQFRYSGRKVDIGQFEKGCMEFIRKKFGNPDDVTTVFTTSTTAELLNRLNATGSAHRGVSRNVAKSLPAGFKALLKISRKAIICSGSTAKPTKVSPFSITTKNNPVSRLPTGW